VTAIATPSDANADANRGRNQSGPDRPVVGPFEGWLPVLSALGAGVLLFKSSVCPARRTPVMTGDRSVTLTFGGTNSVKAAVLAVYRGVDKLPQRTRLPPAY
jgi:hypothetical protein